MKHLYTLFILFLLLIFVACQQSLNSNSSSDRTSSNKRSNRSNKDRDTDRATPPAKIDANAAAVSQAIETLLKSSSPQQESAALKLLRETLAVNELKNTRNRRNDPSLLNVRYPKPAAIKLDSGEVIYWTEYDRLHFAARHLIDCFDTTDIKGKNSWWPAGTTTEKIDQYLQETITKNSNRLQLPREGKTGPGFRYFTFDLPSNRQIRVDVGITSEGRVTSFFPRSGPNVISVEEDEVKRLLELVRGG